MTPLVSVVIVSYQTRQLTLRGITALRAMCTATSYEVIVVDNASTDGSADAVAHTFPDVRVLRLAHNVGFGQAVNAGARLAGGRWLLLVNPDAEPVGDVIAALLHGAETHPGHGIYTGRTLRADGSDDGRSCFGLPTLWSTACFATGLSTMFRRSRLFNPEELPALDRTIAQPVPAVSGCLALVDRMLFESLGGFAPDYFMYSEDIDLCARATAAGARPMLVPGARLVHVGGASSTAPDKIAMVLRGRFSYLRAHWTRPRATVGRTLLATGVAVRAAGSRLTGRAGYWRQVWAQRAVWLPGWPSTPPAAAYEEFSR